MRTLASVHRSSYPILMSALEMQLMAARQQAEAIQAQIRKDMTRDKVIELALGVGGLFAAIKLMGALFDE